MSKLSAIDIFVAVVYFVLCSNIKLLGNYTTTKKFLNERLLYVYVHIKPQRANDVLLIELQYQPRRRSIRNAEYK